jgi:hypothetical protein
LREFHQQYEHGDLVSGKHLGARGVRGAERSWAGDTLLPGGDLLSPP